MARIGNTGDWAIISSVDYEKGDFRNTYAINFSLNPQPTEYFISVTYLGTTYNFGGEYTASTTFDLYETIRNNFNGLGLTALTASIYQSGTNYLSQDQYLVITSTANNTNFTVQTTRPENVNVVQTSFLQSNLQTNTYTFTEFQPVNIIDQVDASKPFDYVPLKAEAQALANGNYVVYGNYTEGYDNVIIDASARKYLKSLNSSSVNLAVTQEEITFVDEIWIKFTFTGEPAAGDVFVITKYNPVDSQYTYSVPYEVGETKSEYINRIAFLIGYYFEGVANVNGTAVASSFLIKKQGIDKC